jgi:hypothetical protein
VRERGEWVGKATFMMRGYRAYGVVGAVGRRSRQLDLCPCQSKHRREAYERDGADLLLLILGLGGGLLTDEGPRPEGELLIIATGDYDGFAGAGNRRGHYHDQQNGATWED